LVSSLIFHQLRRTAHWPSMAPSCMESG
jgi:hypothetical protein